MICLGKSSIAPSQCLTVLKHSHPPALCVRYGRWQARGHTSVLPCRGRTGSLSRQPFLRSCAADDAATFNQTIVYPGAPWVIVHSRSSSIRHTTCMTDLGEEFAATGQRCATGIGLRSRTCRCHHRRRFAWYCIQWINARARDIIVTSPSSDSCWWTLCSRVHGFGVR